ncbi:MAG: bacillithiol biosynthesis cysteine-adding enzyme BshC [Bacteroidetes bacterium]|nr:bacillithiol biosynthesis cysteine-adding enzyme BshC [Bacteroidota bacterium]
MKKHCVDLKKTGQFSTFFLDYLEGKESLRPFYSHLPNLESFGEAIKAKQFSAAKRQTLVEVLESQYVGVPLSPAAAHQLAALREEKTFTVTTGHQLNLFTGPLYFIYKLISLINLAKRLQERYPDYRFVPMYWMATEDHDAAEINYFKLDGVTYRWKTSQRGAVGDFELDTTFQNFLEDLGFAPPVFRDAYSQSTTLAEAVRKYVNELFGAQGLVVLDANDGRLKREFVEVMAADLFTQQPFAAAQASTQALEKLGYSSQIYPRPINLFYLDKGLRERIERDGEEFVVLNTELRFSNEALKTLLQEHPERFSPNVVLRPVYQECILPNLAYVGGPAEVVYWLQLKGVFDAFSIPLPVLLPRNFAVLIPAGIQKKIAQLGWNSEQLFQQFEDWKKGYVQSSSTFDFSLAVPQAQVSQIFKDLANRSNELDVGLPKAFAAGEVRSLKILEQMGVKLRKAEERRLEVDLLRARSVFEFLSPEGSPQERGVNFMQFYLEQSTLLEELIEVFDPFDFRMQLLHIE